MINWNDTTMCGVVSQLCSYKDAPLAVKPLFSVQYPVKIKVHEFVVMNSCGANSNVCPGLLYTYNIVISENNQCVSGAVALQLDVSCNSINHASKVSNGRAVVRQAECSHTICSFQVIRVSKHKILNWKETVMRVWSSNSPVASHMQL